VEEDGVIDKILGPIMAVGLVCAVVLGSYQAGKWHERKWWRQELATKSAALAQTIQHSGAEAEDLDTRLLSAIKDADAQLSDAERIVRDQANTITKLSRVSAPAAPDDPCRPIPAQCLRASR